MTSPNEGSAVDTVIALLSRAQERDAISREEAENAKALVLSLQQQVRNLESRIKDASIALYDWDGYYNPVKKTGNTVELASLIEEAYATLQGKSWTDEK